MEIVPARLSGWHRALCILSTHYRGTRQRPGLVLGLDRGGSCVGKALRVADQAWPEVKARLDARELLTGVYRPRFLPVSLTDGRRVRAYVYLADPSHPQYWTGSEEEVVRLVRGGHGSCGSARDYLADTVTNLSVIGIRASVLRRLLHRVDQGRGEAEDGAGPRSSASEEI